MWLKVKQFFLKNKYLIIHIFELILTQPGVQPGVHVHVYYMNVGTHVCLPHATRWLWSTVVLVLCIRATFMSCIGHDFEWDNIFLTIQSVLSVHNVVATRTHTHTPSSSLQLFNTL